jgi:hypothetical protein
MKVLTLQWPFFDTKLVAKLEYLVTAYSRGKYKLPTGSFLVGVGLISFYGVWLDENDCFLSVFFYFKKYYERVCSKNDTFTW